MANEWLKDIYNVEIKPSSVTGKFNMNGQIGWVTHRSGWGKIMEQCNLLHNDQGVIFDGFLDMTFGTGRPGAIKSNKIPYKEPWVGFFHNTPEIPEWYDYNLSLKGLTSNIDFLHSLENCKGIYTCSNYVRDWLHVRLKHRNIMVETIYHPCAGDDIKTKFNWDKFYSSNERKLVDIGTWLRRFTSIHILGSRIGSDYRICKLWPVGFNHEDPRFEHIHNAIRDEATYLNLPHQRDQWENPNIINIYGLDNQQYDTLLSENIVFLDTWDSNANNVIMECIERHTPIVVRRHSAIEEYLGKEYPLYYETLSNVNDLLTEDKLYCTTNYLRDLYQTNKFSIEKFLSNICESTIYTSISL